MFVTLHQTQIGTQLSRMLSAPKPAESLHFQTCNPLAQTHVLQNLLDLPGLGHVKNLCSGPTAGQRQRLAAASRKSGRPADGWPK